MASTQRLFDSDGLELWPESRLREDQHNLIHNHLSHCIRCVECGQAVLGDKEWAKKCADNEVPKEKQQCFGCFLKERAQERKKWLIDVEEVAGKEAPYAPNLEVRDYIKEWAEKYNELAMKWIMYSTFEDSQCCQKGDDIMSREMHDHRMKAHVTLYFGGWNFPPLPSHPKSNLKDCGKHVG